MNFVKKVWNAIKDAAVKTAKIVASRDADNNLRFFAHIRLYLILSILLEFTIECVSRHSVKSGLVFVFESFYFFSLNILIIFVTFVPVFFVRKKLFVSTLVTFVWLGLGITNGIVTLCRVTPFSVIDILNLPTVFPIIEIYLDKFQIVAICAAILVAIGFVVFLAVKAPKSKTNIRKSAVAALCAFALMPAAWMFGKAANLLPDKFTNLPDAYKAYGFPYCFCTSVVDRGIETPTDYSDNKIDEILEALKKHADKEPAEKPNIIFVQLESFFNVNDLKNVTFSENPIPNFTEYSERGISGYLTVPVLGAGTVNTEFEILTGMSVNIFGAGEHPYKTVLTGYTCESIAYNLSEIGYSTHAVHNYRGTFYQRHKVYQNLGFQSFTPLEYMCDAEYNISGAWPKDNVLTSEIFDALRSTDGSDFVMTVTVQGHGKYPPNALPEDYTSKITASFIDGKIEGGLSDINGLEYYVNQLSETDEFVKELMDAVDAFDEKTVVVLYGDHLPSLSIDDNELESGSIYKTPYIILSNYGLEDSGKEIGDIYSYQLGSNVLKLLGISNGLMTKLHQFYADDPNYAEWFKDLEYDMIGYNILGGISPRYVYGGNTEYYPKITDMRLGVKDIVITHCEISDGVLSVYGENFTEWSKLVADGTVIDDTEFVSDELVTVKIDDSALLPSKIAVAQVADGGYILGKTDEMLTIQIDNGRTDESKTYGTDDE